MAETFLFNIAERVLAKIVHLPLDEVRLAFNVKTDLKKLEDTMISIKTVLLDAERQQHQNEKLRLCMWKLRDIFYDAEDVIDDFRCEALRKQDAINHPNINNLKVRVLSSFCLPLSFSLKMSHKIKDINGRLGELATEWNSFDLRQCNDSRHVFRRETISFVDSTDVIGRDEDKENIISMLMKPSEDRNVPVIPIVGIGGLGKTTLAQFVYNDDRVTSLFPLKIWICVSEEFDLSRLLKLIIQSINKEENCDDLTLEALHACLRSLLNDKKFLLVLDDVWNENQAKWVELRNLLRSTDGFSPSKIIVTTRSLKVASIMSSIPPYILKGLSLDDCLTLFTKWAFNEGDERHPNLTRIGEEIVKKCKGVPLALRTLGSLLFQKTDESDWIYIRESDIWRLEQNENDILPELKLSYKHLPSHLQRCLAFLSLYKKDEIYYSDKVIRLWMANGLLEYPNQNQEWEDVGKRYLNELLSRCLIQKEKDFCLYFTFKMHDLVHDLVLDVSQKECKIVNSETETVDENVRHLLLCDEKLVEVPRVLREMKNVKTIIIQDASKESKTIHESLINLCVSNFKYLRALELRDSPLTALPNSIGALKHLRDLDLAKCEGIRELPRSFYKLRSLQSLNLGGTGLKQLPDSVQRLIELRHLEITVKAEHLKEIRAGCWTSLQYLKLNWCIGLECLPEGMQYLKSLRTLVLFRCGSLVSLPRSLKFLTKLEHLEIVRCFRINLKMELEEEEDKDLQLSLKTFSLLGLDDLGDLPRLLLQGSSSTLQQLRIKHCLELSVLPVWLLNLTSLRELEISSCHYLSALPEGIDRLTNLRKLTIRGCPELSKRYRKNRGEDWHKIAHIRKVVIKD
ncbi:disease resistance protein RGA2-like [Gossypium arboreum]|uniref:Disease resistance protein RGA3 n=1 Tax=Gossypium arboreum TaxID=29729 RepID=A0ABR0MJ42_GOSAR|nr:disease resistance protein RGA2-like [Gossypium arboreum]KAK5773245.1 hypothetical protein PVK06_049550 [Gossypium arboreum]